MGELWKHVRNHRLCSSNRFKILLYSFRKSNQNKQIRFGDFCFYSWQHLHTGNDMKVGRFWHQVSGEKYETTSSAGLNNATFAFVKHPKQWKLSSLLSPNTWMLSRVSWCVRWDLAFACERSKLAALTAAYLWNSSKTTLIRFWLALSEISLCLSSSLSVCLSLSLFSCVVRFAYLPSFPELSCFSVILLWGWCVCGWWGCFCYLEGIFRFNITLTSKYACWAST